MTRGLRPRPLLAVAGFTLIEMMVALAIGLAVVSALVAACMASVANARHTDAVLQITEDGALALQVMRQQVAQAGFSQARGVDGGGLVLHRFVAIAGCEAANFTDLNASILVAANCNASEPDPATSDSLELAFEGDVLPGKASNAILGGPGGGAQPLDCLGNSFARTHDDATGDDYWLNDSKFYITDGSLYCHGPGHPAGAALVQNVETLKVTYGMAAAAAGSTGAGQVAYYGGAPAPGSLSWANVVSVRLCVQVRSATRILDKHSAATLGMWIDCRNARRMASDGYLRRSFATTIALQNKLR